MTLEAHSEEPPQTYARGGRRALDAAWLAYIGQTAPFLDATSCPSSLDQGVTAFNQERFFESHEAFEEAWNSVPYPARLFCLSLVKIATAFAHAQRDRPLSARRLLADGIRLLRPFVPAAWGIDTQRLLHDAQSWKEADAIYPPIRRAGELHATKEPR